MFRIRRQVYLDNNATTPVSKNVRRRMNYIIKHYHGNPSSLYKPARNSAIILEESRKIIARTINANPTEIIFTGSASEANNTILKSLSGHFFPAKNNIVSLPIEHPSVLNTLEYLQTIGIQIRFCPVDRFGFADLDQLNKLIDSNTFLVCCMFANNELGTIQDIKRIAEIAHARGILVMSDCVQALGKTNIDVRELNLDYASFSAHKIYGPKGIGLLYSKEGNPLTPLIHGGHQEKGLRAGTESIHNIAGFAAACLDVPADLGNLDRIQQLKQRFIDELKKIKADVIISSPDQKCLCNTLSATFPRINNSIFMAFLDLYGIAVSAGSACNTQEDTPSHVLQSVGLTAEQARQTIRFSLSKNTKWKELKYTLNIIRDFVENRIPPVNVIMPTQLNEDLLFSEDLYIFDIRFGYDRKMLKSLPNSHEGSFLRFPSYISQIPKDKNILVVCQGGYNAPVVAYYLKYKKFRKVSFLFSGLAGWKLLHPDLYHKYAGKNITILKAGKKDEIPFT